MATLYYFHDPMCSWCWGYRPVWQALKEALPAGLPVENIVGGLAEDTDQLMPIELQEHIKSHWRHIESELGTFFNFDFWAKNQPRRSTYQACRAVLCARREGLEEAMIEAIQRAYYVRAMNPSDNDVLQRLAREIGLNEEQFCEAMRSADVNQQLLEQVEFSRSINTSGFPSLFLLVDEGDEGNRALPIAINYKDYRSTLDQIVSYL
ncbi:hypothetical protein imdm_1970 [gamma proteobacterium IMCC2047]|nr:hypothetical protein imdm_1970 [gamma proteobacterium IMCC2047]